MATRPSFTTVQSGDEAWLADFNDAINSLFNAPLAIARYVNVAAFPDAALYDDCLAIDQSTGTIYKSDGVSWDVLISTAIDQSTLVLSFSSPSTSSGTFYAGGFYDLAASDSDFSPAENVGTSNSSSSAHIFVVLGATAVDEITLTVTGTSITETGTRTTSDTETIVIPDTTVVDTYFETSKKWIGLVTVETTAGTAKTCNYGRCRYWDGFNTDYSLLALSATWLGGANDTGADLIVRHHKPTGWTFNSAAPATPPAATTSLVLSHVTETEIVNGEYGSWEKASINQTVLGSAGEGLFLEIVTTANSAFEFGNASVSIFSL